MKSLALLSILALGLSSPLMAGTNYSDDLDKNTTPAPIEEREEEVINKSDFEDTNVTPAPQEEREMQEDLESDVLQTDDPERTYDSMDEEFDE